MEAHRLQIWLNEHGLAEIGADIRETTDSAAPGLHDPTAPVGPMVSVGLKFAQLARPGGASGRGRSRSGGRGSSRSRRSEDAPDDSVPPEAHTPATEAPGVEDGSLRFKGCSKLQTFLRVSGLEYLSEPLKKIGIEMYDDVLEFSQEDFESLGIEQHEVLFHAIHGAGKLRRMTDRSWDANDFAAPVRRSRITCVAPRLFDSARWPHPPTCACTWQMAHVVPSARTLASSLAPSLH